MLNQIYKLQLCEYKNAEFDKLKNKKIAGTPNMTHRVKRLYLLCKILCVLGLGLPLLVKSGTVAFANLIMTPIENNIKSKFLRRAKNKLRSMPNLIKIGITGSYGKTTVKNILYEILSTKYKTVVSPASFNTPMGFAKTVNEHLQKDTQVLIMEMGARKIGDIDEMCDLLKPNHGIITSIGHCHIQSFKNIKNIIATKNELFENIPFDGNAITDGDSPLCGELYHPNKTNVHFAEAQFETKLLGKHNQKNILLCAEMARKLGVEENRIISAVKKIKPTPHRLELINLANGVKILDDSYNSNPESAKTALDVIAEMPGRKIIQTPGFVEQGVNNYSSHIKFGKQISTVADIVIIVGQLNKKSLKEGLKNFTGQVFYVDSREDAKKIYPRILRNGDILLIENDIPENY